MPSKKPTKLSKYKVGDVGTFYYCDNEGDPLIEPTKAVIVSISKKVYYRFLLLEISDEWVDLPVDNGFKDVLTVKKWRDVFYIEKLGGIYELELCDTNDCSQCKSHEKCSQITHIARCDISESGQSRGEGKYNPTICEERNCKYRFICGTQHTLVKVS
jgi:hypothetical protein